MKYPSLARLIERLKISPRVRGVFVTGSTATALTPSSDIDLVVILDKNAVKIQSVYTTIENHFSDIFFFDVAFLRQLEAKREVPGNSFEGMVITWLAMGKIEYDPDKILQELRTKIDLKDFALIIPKQEQYDLWVKVNYNFIANIRYYRSNDELYRQALELRLAHSVVELVTAYFSFRNIPWRGEKAAVEYFRANDSKFLGVFQSYTTSATLEQKMRNYEKLFQWALHGEFRRWDNDFVIPLSIQHQFDPGLTGFWDSLVAGKDTA